VKKDKMDNRITKIGEKLHQMYIVTVEMQKEYKIVIGEDESKAEEMLKAILKNEENLIIGSPKIIDIEKTQIAITKPM